MDWWVLQYLQPVIVKNSGYIIVLILSKSSLAEQVFM